MWTFAGLVFVGLVVWYWLRRIARALVGLLAIIEASIDRTARRTGEPPIRADVDSSLL